MRYETFDPEKHDLDKVAKLTYDVDFRTFDMLFKDERFGRFFQGHSG